MLLLILIVLLAAAGGFLGELLELAAWTVGLLALAGALVGFFVYRAFRRLKDRVV